MLVVTGTVFGWFLHEGSKRQQFAELSATAQRGQTWDTLRQGYLYLLPVIARADLHFANGGVSGTNGGVTMSAKIVALVEHVGSGVAKMVDRSGNPGVIGLCHEGKCTQAEDDAEQHSTEEFHTGFTLSC
jgi:hypothetical protein